MSTSALSYVVALRFDMGGRFDAKPTHAAPALAVARRRLLSARQGHPDKIYLGKFDISLRET